VKTIIAIPENHPATEGHFPGMPIMPGAVLLSEIAAALGLGGKILNLRDAKFTHPVLPGTQLHINAQPVEGGLKFEASLPDGTLALTGSILHDRQR
jgi:3-hydroxymyristoyl/3-hydroxydecanoyl-(acyl carrier protein) dehydratase